MFKTVLALPGDSRGTGCTDWIGDSRYPLGEGGESEQLVWMEDAVEPLSRACYPFACATREPEWEHICPKATV